MKRSLFLGCAAALAVAHFIWLMCYFQPAITQPDSNGYFAQAARIANTGKSWFEPESPVQYVGMHWLKTPEGRYYSRYPAGFPLLLAGPFKLFGPSAALVTNVLLCSLAVLGLYLLAARWVGPGWGLLAAALVAVNPLVNEWALSYFAHTASAFFLVWGLYALARWEEKPSLAWGFAAGLLLGIEPSVRYPEALFCVAAAAFVVVTVWRRRESWGSAVACGAGMTLPVLALAIHNQLAFGAFWRTGYSLTNEQTGFSLSYFTQHAVSYIEALSSSGAGVIFGLGLAGIAVLASRAGTRRKGALLALVVVPLTLVYMAYYWSGGQMSMRFLVPTVYVYALAAVWLLSLVAKEHARSAAVAGIAVLFVAACSGLPSSARTLDRLEKIGAPLATVTKTLEEKVPAGSLVIASDPIQQHLDFVGRWKLVDESAMRAFGPGRMGGAYRRMGAAAEGEPNPMQAEKMQDRMKRYEGLAGIDRTRAFVLDLWKWAGDKGKVYWVTEESRYNSFVDSLPLDWPDRFKIVATIQLPKVDLRDRMGGPGGMGGPPGGGPAGGGMSPPAGGPQDDPQRRLGPRGERAAGGPTGAGPMGGGGGPMGSSLLSGEKLVVVEWTAK